MVVGRRVAIVEQSEADWDRTIDINLKGTWLCLKYEIQQMLKQGRPGAIAANINIDGINWFGRTRDLSLIGKGKSSIDKDVVALAAMQKRTVVADQFPDRGTFYRSDQFNFAKIGVPAAYLKSGTDVIGKPAGFGRAADRPR